MIEVQNAIAMRMPDGSYIKVETHDGEYEDGNCQEQTWKSLDVSWIWPDGRGKLLASFDFEESKGLRTLVFDGAQKDPIFVKEVKRDG